MTASDRTSVRVLGDAFGRHLREPSSTTAVDVANALSEIGDDDRASLLTAFANRGPHTVPAPSWAGGGACHLSLDLPQNPAPGDLWFDPVDVSCSIAQFYPGPTSSQTTSWL